MEAAGRTLFLHLGMSKTATTYLQTEVFPEVRGLHFFDQPRTRHLEGGPFQGMLARAFKRSPAVWEKKGERLLTELLDASETDDSTDVLISDQSAGPAMWETGPYVGPRWERERKDPFFLRAHLDALAKVGSDFGFDDVRILLIFRRQDEWIASKYAQRSDRILHASQGHFEERIDYYLDPSRGYLADGIVLDYMLLRRQLVAAVGADNVLMLPYELLEQAPCAYLERIIDFLDAKGDNRWERIRGLLRREEKNVRSSADDTWRLRPRTMRDIPLPPSLPRRMSRLVKRAVRAVSRLGRRGRSIRLTPALRERVLARFGPSNRRLERHLPVQLAKYGYVPGRTDGRSGPARPPADETPAKA
jgi:hypothetical protein